MECSSEDVLKRWFTPLVDWIGAYAAAPQQLDLHLIGPNVPRTAPSWIAWTASTAFAARAHCHCIEYDKFLDTEDARRPDLIVSFHAGRWGYSKWQPTLQNLVKQQTVPTVAFVITSYTIQEAEEDSEVLQQLLKSCLWEPEENAFASKMVRETATAPVGAENYRENAAWQA